MKRRNVTDRAKRYRANRNAPEGPKTCGYCGSVRNVEVEHIDGVEDNCDPENLIWACRSCNTSKGYRFRELGLGQVTNQFNPARTTRGALSFSEWGETVDTLTGAWPQSKTATAAAIRKAQATPAVQRRAFARRMARNPGLLTAAEYIGSVQTLHDFSKGEVFQGLDESVRKVMNTPASRFDRLRAECQQRNPAGQYPTFAQYARAVSIHTRGAHDEGGSIIHATPARLRSQYARQIAQGKRVRRGAGGDVPF